MLKLRLSSVVIRQALTSTFVMMIAIAILGIAATRSIEMQQRENLLHTVDAAIAGLTDVMVQGGVEGLKRRIADRTQLAAQIEQPPIIFLLTRRGIVSQEI